MQVSLFVFRVITLKLNNQFAIDVCDGVCVCGGGGGGGGALECITSVYTDP